MRVAAGHAALAAAFFSPALLAGRVLVPGDLLRTIYPWGAYLPQAPSHNAELLDVVQQFYPWFLVLRDRLLSGALPLWNPDSALGLPFAANELTASWFPLSLLALLPPVLGWNLLLLCRLVLAGTGAFVLLRELGARRLGALLGSVAWAYSLPFVLFLPMSIANVNALLPWLVAAAVRIARNPGPRSAAAFGAALLLVHLGGQPEAAFFGAAAACVFAVAASPRRGTFGWLLAGGAAGTLAAGIQLVPFLEYLSRSRALLEEGARARPFPLSRLVTWAVPSFFGSPAHRSAWGGTSFIDHAGFAGVVFLGASGLVLLARDRRLRAAWAVLAAVVLLCYVVPPLPVLGKVRTPRLLPLAALAVVVLGARGLGRLLAAARAGRPSRAAAVLSWPLLLALAVLAAVRAPERVLARTALPGIARATAVLAVAALLVALPRVGAKVRAAGLGAVVLVDLWAPSFDYHGSARPGDVFFETGLTRFLKAQEPGWRLLPLGFTMPPATNLPQKIPSLLSYDALDDLDQSRFLRRMGGFYETLFSTVDENAPKNPRVLELACARFLLDEPLARRRDTAEETLRSGLDVRLAYDAPDGRIWELPSARPRAWASGSAEIDPGFRRFWPALDARDARSSSVAWIDAPDASAGAGGAASARLASYAPGRVSVAVSADGPAWLVVAEGFDRGWRAQVDGAPARVYRANGVFCGVPLPAGAKEVVLTYLPASFVAGAALSVLGACVLGAGLARRRAGA